MRVGLLAAMLLLFATGCGQNALTLHQQNQALAQQQQTVAQRSDELHRRVGSLDADNQELESLLAQTRQQNQLLKDELSAVRDQLRTANQQIAAVRTDKQGLQRHAQALAASVERRAQATIQPNNSLLGELKAVQISGVEVRQDRDVIRIELPGEKLFHAGTATFQPGALSIVESVMAEVVRNYPNQLVGVEGHTDSDPISTTQFPSNHHLSTARATAVYDHLTRRFNIPSRQLFVVGHGANHPVVSNATAPGKARNRRVELVVYPDTYR